MEENNVSVSKRYLQTSDFFQRVDSGTISALLRIQKFPLDIVFFNHPLSNNRHQGKIPSYVNWLQNTFLFFKKYQVDLILFTNHTAHTYHTKQIFPPK